MGLAGGHAFQCHNAIFHIHLGLGAADVAMIQQFRFDFHADPRIRILSGTIPFEFDTIIHGRDPGQSFGDILGHRFVGFVIHVARQGDSSILGTDLNIFVLQVRVIHVGLLER